MTIVGLCLIPALTISQLCSKSHYCVNSQPRPIIQCSWQSTLATMQTDKWCSQLVLTILCLTYYVTSTTVHEQYSCDIGKIRANFCTALFLESVIDECQSSPMSSCRLKLFMYKFSPITIFFSVIKLRLYRNTYCTQITASSTVYGGITSSIEYLILPTNNILLLQWHSNLTTYYSFTDRY